MIKVWLLFVYMCLCPFWQENKDVMDYVKNYLLNNKNKYSPNLGSDSRQESPGTN